MKVLSILQFFFWTKQSLKLTGATFTQTDWNPSPENVYRKTSANSIRACSFHKEWTPGLIPTWNLMIICIRFDLQEWIQKEGGQNERGLRHEASSRRRLYAWETWKIQRGWAQPNGLKRMGSLLVTFDWGSPCVIATAASACWSSLSSIEARLRHCHQLVMHFGCIQHHIHFVTMTNTFV